MWEFEQRVVCLLGELTVHILLCIEQRKIVSVYSFIIITAVAHVVLYKI